MCLCRFMSSSLLRVASDHNSVVAVVGKGHLPGIKKHWNQPIEVSNFYVGLDLFVGFFTNMLTLTHILDY